ncbi:hypothetical protein [uncultured Algibacter sp.]|uniref:hypothetical protein n=1 Tax=uncultured Algibacter sp. TaxID=298659 RepID=UPI0026329BC8|nr:hypothetical protein [uncultured Algibacter sp.]
MSLKRITLVVTALFVLVVFVLVAKNPLLIKSIKSKYKSTDQFIAFKSDSRIKYEIGMEDKASLIYNILENKKTYVEQVVGSSFKEPINIYICGSQERFNEYVYLSKNVKGAVFWGKLFLSPGAFNSARTEKLLTHELTHFLFYSHLGESEHIKNIPLWFREGYADFVANGGKYYTKKTKVSGLMTSDEQELFLSGKVDYWFNTNNPRDAVNNGVINWKNYRIGTLFVSFMYDLSPTKFNILINKILAGQNFKTAFETIYSTRTNKMLSHFRDYINSEKNSS